MSLVSVWVLESWALKLGSNPVGEKNTLVPEIKTISIFISRSCVTRQLTHFPWALNALGHPSLQLGTYLGVPPAYDVTLRREKLTKQQDIPVSEILETCGCALLRKQRSIFFSYLVCKQDILHLRWPTVQKNYFIATPTFAFQMMRTTMYPSSLLLNYQPYFFGTDLLWCRDSL